MRLLPVLPVLPVEEEAISDSSEERPSGDAFEAGGSHACLCRRGIPSLTAGP